VPIATVMKSIWPFYFATFATLMLVTYVPALSLWLPSVFH
jgi:TRAP-type C4-dicarboxylate transport system permease large subunit